MTRNDKDVDLYERENHTGQRKYYSRGEIDKSLFHW